MPQPLLAVRVCRARGRHPRWRSDGRRFYFDNEGAVWTFSIELPAAGGDPAIGLRALEERLRSSRWCAQSGEGDRIQPRLRLRVAAAGLRAPPARSE